MDRHIADFLTWGRRRRRWADSTCDGYRRRVTDWLAWCRREGVRDARATPRDVRRWLDTLHPSPAVRSHGHTALLAWFDWRVDAQACKRNPVRQVERVPVRRSVPRSLDLDAVRAAMDTAAKHGAKWHLYLGFLFYAGLRRAEACAVRWVDIEGTDAWIRVTGKGGQEAIVPVHDDLRRLIVRWRTEGQSPVWCFPGRYGDRPMSVASATQWTRRILDEAGLPGVTGHQSRHTLARQLLEGGHDLATVMDALRHQSLSSATVYSRAHPAQVAEAVGGLDW